MDRLDRMLALCRQRVPRLALVPKSEVWWMRALGVLLRPVVPDFATRYTTVLGSTVYLPADQASWDRDTLAATLAHELVHQLDMARWGPLFYLSYAVFLPVGRTARAQWERRAYTVELLLAWERGGEARMQRVARELERVFSGPAYLWMWPGRRAAARFLEPAIRAVRSGEAGLREPYRSILAAWRTPGVSLGDRRRT